MGLEKLKLEELPHYTYDDYVQWEGQWEIIRGIPYAMVPAPAIKHQDLCVNIIYQLKQLLEECHKCKVLLPVDWQITEDTVVQPDALVVCSEDVKIEGKKLTIAPALVFEVLSPSTNRKDRVLKYQLYQEAGVKYYCIIDPDTNSAVVFTLGNNEYKKAEDFKEGKMTFDLGPCTIRFDFNKVFSEP